RLALRCPCGQPAGTTVLSWADRFFTWSGSMSLTMIQLEPDMGRLIRWASGRRLITGHGEDDLGYALHALLAANFGDLAPKPFVLRQRTGQPAKLLGYSAEAADALRLHAAAFADPDAAEALGLQSLAAKAMPEKWNAGQRLGFEVRV